MASAGSKYALLDSGNNIILEQEFEETPPRAIAGLRWVPLVYDLKIPNEHQFESGRIYYFGPDKVVISNTVDEKSMPGPARERTR